jgi:hypothetical protein
MPRPTRRVLIGTAAAALAAAAGLGALFALTPRVRPPAAVPGEPLLRQNDSEEPDLFTDRQVGVQFVPPGGWSMQARTTESPREHKPERMVVKYKRLIPGHQVAWLRVSVADAPADQSPADLLKTRKPPEPDWKVRKSVEDGLTVGGQPAARVTFGGPFETDDKGDRDFTCEVVAVRPRPGEPRVFYFAGTFMTGDPTGQKRVRAAIDSAAFDPARFAP